MRIIFSCLFEDSLVWFENETKSDGNPVIFLANAMEIPLLQLVQNPCHVKQIKHGKMTWNSHGIWCQFGPNCRRFVTRNDMEFP